MKTNCVLFPSNLKVISDSSLSVLAIESELPKDLLERDVSKRLKLLIEVVFKESESRCYISSRFA